jgi:hypothetical protein
VDDADRLEEVLEGGALGKNSANPRLQSFDGPPFVSVGAGQDDPGPHPLQAKLTADLEGPRGLRVHEEDLGNATPQYFPHGGCRDLAHHDERTISAEEATEAGPEKGAVTQKRDADRRRRNGRGGSAQRRPPGRPCCLSSEGVERKYRRAGRGWQAGRGRFTHDGRQGCPDAPPAIWS